MQCAIKNDLLDTIFRSKAIALLIKITQMTARNAKRNDPESIIACRGL